MKKAKFITALLVMGLVAISCESYDDFDESRPTVIGFLGLEEVNLPAVPDGGSFEFPIPVFVSDIASTDRTFTVVVDSDAVADLPKEEDEDGNEITIEEAGPENYSFPSSVTIPANEREATLPFTAIDGGSLTADKKAVILKFAPGQEADIVSGRRVVLYLRK